MDHLRRLIWFSVGVLIAFVFGLSTATAQTIPATRTESASLAPFSGAAIVAGQAETPTAAQCIHPDPFAACRTFTNGCYQGTTYCLNNRVPDTINGSSNCTGQDSRPVLGHVKTCSLPRRCTSPAVLEGTVCATYTCPNGYNLSGTNCVPVAPGTCPTGKVYKNNACACPSSRDEATEAGVPEVVQNAASGFPSNPACVSGCSFSVAWQVCATRTGQPRQCWGEVTGASGSTCTPPATDGPGSTPPNDPVRDCIDKGMTYGTVNGVGTCLPVGTPGTPTTATGPTGTTTTTNPDGSTSTTTTQTTRDCNSLGTCTDTTTTTTTTRNAQGQVTGTTTSTSSTTQPPGTRGLPGATGGGMGDDPADEDPSSFGGSCGGFTCSGDAIQCAIASEQHRRNCETLGARTNATQAATDQAVNDAVAGTGLGENFLPRTTVDMATINTGERINAGSCPGSQTISTPVGAFTLDLGFLCSPLQWFGWIILAASLLVAGRITFEGV